MSELQALGSRDPAAACQLPPVRVPLLGHLLWPRSTPGPRDPDSEEDEARRLQFSYDISVGRRSGAIKTYFDA